MLRRPSRMLEMAGPPRPREGAAGGEGGGGAGGGLGGGEGGGLGGGGPAGGLGGGEGFKQNSKSCHAQQASESQSVMTLVECSSHMRCALQVRILNGYVVAFARGCRTLEAVACRRVWVVSEV